MLAIDPSWQHFWRVGDPIDASGNYWRSRLIPRSMTERENCPVLRNSEKANGSSLPPSPRIVAMVRREREEEKGVHEGISSMEKTLQNTLWMPSLRDGNAIETLLMTAQIKKDFVNHPVPSTTEPSTSLVRVGTDACESIINSILRYKDNDFHKNAWPR
ncbi:uncharacterized protein TNCV_1749261 [Trichonephila clavipes]|nr:uncharacterized protein TNCV_1749261 [Trichonephila clavipes]